MTTTFFLEPGKHKRYRLVVVAAPKGHEALVGHEPGNLDAKLHRADRQRGNRGDAACIRRGVHDGAVGTHDAYGGLRHTATGLIDHGHAQVGLLGRLRGSIGDGKDEQRHRDRQAAPAEEATGRTPKGNTIHICGARGARQPGIMERFRRDIAAISSVFVASGVP